MEAARRHLLDRLGLQRLEHSWQVLVTVGVRVTHHAVLLVPPRVHLEGETKTKTKTKRNATKLKIKKRSRPKRGLEKQNKTKTKRKKNKNENENETNRTLKK